MSEEENIFRGIEVAQGRLKIISDLGIRGIIFHLAISAFSVTFAFQKTAVPREVMQIANAIVTFLALLSTILITKDVQRVRRRLLDWHEKVGLKLDENEFMGIIWVARLYAVFCLMLIAFWVGLWFVPLNP